MDGWNTLVSFWETLFSGAMLVLGSVFQAARFEAEDGEYGKNLLGEGGFYTMMFAQHLILQKRFGSSQLILFQFEKYVGQGIQGISFCQSGCNHSKFGTIRYPTSFN